MTAASTLAEQRSLLFTDSDWDFDRLKATYTASLAVEKTSAYGPSFETRCFASLLRMKRTQ